jgi:hypothetical protein
MQQTDFAHVGQPVHILQGRFQGGVQFAKQDDDINRGGPGEASRPQICEQAIGAFVMAVDGQEERHTPSGTRTKTTHAPRQTC